MSHWKLSKRYLGLFVGNTKAIHILLSGAQCKCGAEEVYWEQAVMLWNKLFPQYEDVRIPNCSSHSLLFVLCCANGAQV